MDNKQFGATQSNRDDVAGPKDLKNTRDRASETGSGEKAGRAKGAAAGGAGKSATNKESKHSFDTNAEQQDWRKEFKQSSYFKSDTPYEQVAPAYQYGWECCKEHNGEKFQDVEPQLRADWEQNRGDSKLNWAEARMAVQDAWSCAKQKSSDGAN